MTYTTLTLTRADGIAHVQLSRPDALNTMNAAFWDELPAAFAAIDDDSAIRAAVGQFHRPALHRRAGSRLGGAVARQRGRGRRPRA